MAIPIGGHKPRGQTSGRRCAAPPEIPLYHRAGVAEHLCFIAATKKRWAEFRAKKKAAGKKKWREKGQVRTLPRSEDTAARHFDQVHAVRLSWRDRDHFHSHPPLCCITLLISPVHPV